MTFIHKPRLDLRGQLNEAQYQAATHMDGPLLIVAGAGSGKTRTLVHRVAWLIDQGITPASILLLTFTRKAAEEMLSRCEEILGGMDGKVSGGTFHALSTSVLRVYAPKLGFTNRFEILDREDAELMMGTLRSQEETAKRNSKFPKRHTILNIFSQAVNKDMTVPEVVKKSYFHLKEYIPGLERLFVNYKVKKIASNSLDFDDMLLYLEKLMIENEDIREEIAARYNYILVDEYQDTNSVQARITAFLGLGHKNVTAVGDDAQSIYSFRGANFKNIMDFPNIYQGTKILRLEDNYRSHPQILHVANHILGQADEGFNKVLRPIREDGPLAKIITLRDLRQEAAKVADLIEGDLAAGVPMTDIAVLFRNSAHSFELETELVKREIPYTKFGGRKFLESAHVKDFLAILKVSVNPKDEINLKRILVRLNGVGPKGAEAIVTWCTSRDEYFSVLDQAKVTRSYAREGLSELKELLLAISPLDVSPKEVTERVFDYYSARLPGLFPDDHPERLTDLEEMRIMLGNTTDLVSFLDDITLDPPNNLSVGHKKSKERGDLTLSTVHSAKGLEWARVYLISAVEGRFPSARSNASERSYPWSRGQKSSKDGTSQLQEELRLMYVAVTRAKDRLVITMPLFCPSWNSAERGGPSRFLNKIDRDQVEIIHGESYDEDRFEEVDKVIHFGHDLAKRPIANPRGGFFGDDGDDIFDNEDASQLYDDDFPMDDGSQLYDDGFESGDEERNFEVPRAKKSQSKAMAKHMGKAMGMPSGLPKAKAAGLPAGGKAIKGEVILEPYVGQKVHHQGFGLGSVTEVTGGTVTIDFDQFGEKKVMTRYAKLTVP
ncbi:MAG: UvrD-helicase domain-containing protein [Deltaproteobacteria bacterium]|jgi:DNA helicase-2/ATP-dependent DNA helicase PcrA|nr:UvrD-helicase domain-containing protein [Deltaproteobacteria bacterium]